MITTEELKYRERVKGLLDPKAFAAARGLCEGSERHSEYVRGQAELLIDITFDLCMDDRDLLVVMLSEADMEAQSKAFLAEYQRLSNVAEGEWSPVDEQDWHVLSSNAVELLVRILTKGAS